MTTSGNPRYVLVVALAVVASGCAPTRNHAYWEEYRRPREIARRSGHPSWALKGCVDRWVGPLAKARERVLQEFWGSSSSPHDIVAMLEVGNATEPFYEYALVADGHVVTGLAEGQVERVPASQETSTALRQAWGARGSLKSDQTQAPAVSDGACYFVTLRIRDAMAQFAVYEPPMNAIEWSTGNVMKDMAIELRALWQLAALVGGPGPGQ